MLIVVVGCCGSWFVVAVACWCRCVLSAVCWCCRVLRLLVSLRVRVGVWGCLLRVDVVCMLQLCDVCCCLMLLVVVCCWLLVMALFAVVAGRRCCVCGLCVVVLVRCRVSCVVCCLLGGVW